MSATEHTAAVRQTAEQTKTKTAEGPRASAPAAEQAGVGNVDKIRDILFGSQIREYDSRLTRLEETMVKENADLRDSMKKRLDSLENFVKKELESLQARLKSEREQRSEAAQQLSQELKGLGESLTRKIRELEDQGAEANRGVRQEILQQSNELSEEIRARHEETAAALELRVGELGASKTDRAALASMFTEVAMRLNDEFRMPGSDE